MALVTCNQLTQALAGLLAQLNNETMWVQGGRLYLQQGDGRTINVDMVPGLLPLLETMNVCNVWMQGDDMHTQDRKYTSTDVLATCNGLYRVWEQLSNRIDNLPVDRFVSGMHSYNPATKVLTLIMSDDTVVDIPLSDLIGDILDSIQLQLRDCNGDPLEQDAQVPTCAQMNAALVTLETTLTQALNDGLDYITAALGNYQLKLRDADGNDLPGGTQVYSTVQTNSAINDAVAAAVANLQVRLRDCNSALIPLDTAIPTCAQMNVAIGNALASLPTEVHVVSGAYSEATDALVLTMNTGPAVSIPLTTLINDTINTIPHATIQEVATGSSGNRFVDASVFRQRMNIPVMGWSGYSNKIATDVVAAKNYPVAIGDYVLPNFTPDVDGNSNTAVGYQALSNLDAGSYITAIGHNAGFSLVAAASTPPLLQFTDRPVGTPTVGNTSASVFVGGTTQVLRAFGAVCIGNQDDGGPRTAVSSSSFIGSFAGRADVETISSTFTGVSSADRAPATAPVRVRESCIGVGTSAGASVASTRGCVALGGYAGYQSFGGFGIDSVSVGESAGRSSLLQDSVAVGAGVEGIVATGHTAIGSGAGKNSTATNGVFIGRNAADAYTEGTPVLLDPYTSSAILTKYGGELDFPAGTLTPGTRYILRGYLGAVGTSTQANRSYIGVALSATRLLVVTGISNESTASPQIAFRDIDRVQLTPLNSNDGSVAVGANAVVTAPNTVVLGGPSTTAVRSQGVFYSNGVALTSDARLKSTPKEINMDAARAFVKGLRFCEYTKYKDYIRARGALQRLAVSHGGSGVDYAAALANFDDDVFKGTGRSEVGLIAQEVKVLAELHGFEHVVSEDEFGVLSLDYNSIQAIINAVVIDALEL